MSTVVQTQGQAVLATGPALSGAPVRILATFAGSQNSPEITVLDGTNAATVFDARPGGADRLPVKKLRIQNVSDAVVYFAKNQIASASIYHGILQAGTAAKDGKGGVIDLGDDQPLFVSVFCASATKSVVVDKIFENQR